MLFNRTSVLHTGAVRPSLLLLVLAGLASLPALGADTDSSDSKTQPAPATQPKQDDSLDPDQLYAVGKALFDRYAPPEIKAKYEFPSKEQWDAFLPRLQKALNGNSMQDLAALEPEARRALRYLDSVPNASGLADWLRQRIELMDAARALSQPVPETPAPLPQPPELAPAPGPTPPPVPAPERPPAPPPPRSGWNIPAYNFFYARLLQRPAPADAGELMPVLVRAFTLEHVPGALSWMAEVESSLNPSARSPTGAKGLFQLMPDTAKSLGLSTWLPDERMEPDKSARAAARLLHSLFGTFHSWPLAIAAYNAGAGRVKRILASHPGAKSFADIAGSLPVETRLYVPKVLATIAVRTGVTPDQLSRMSE